MGEPPLKRLKVPSDASPASPLPPHSNAPAVAQQHVPGALNNGEAPQEDLSWFFSDVFPNAPSTGSARANSVESPRPTENPPLNGATSRPTPEVIRAHALRDSQTPSRRFRRVEITGVEEDASPVHTRRLLGRCAVHGTPVTILLRDDWYFSTSETGSAVRPGDIVHVVATKLDGASDLFGADELRCDASGSFWLVVHPDTLVNITNVGESFRCLRKSVFSQLSHMSGGPGTEPSPHAVIGDIMHDLFEQAVLGGVKRPEAARQSQSHQNGTMRTTRPPLMRANSAERLIDSEFSRDSLEKQLEELLQGRVEALHACGHTFSSALQAAAPLVPNIVDWAERFYMRHLPDSNSAIPHNNERHATAQVSVSKVHATEEGIWSPMMGLKGKVDISVQIRLQMRPRQATHEALPTYTYIVPLELKSGKQLHDTGVSNEHQAQVMLYGVLMSDFYGVDVQHALLYYMKTNSMVLLDVAGRQPHTSTRNSDPNAHTVIGEASHYVTQTSTHSAVMIRSLIQRRNEIASATAYALRSLPKEPVKTLEGDDPASRAKDEEVSAPRAYPLPEPLQKAENVCKYCDHAATCALQVQCGDDSKRDEHRDWLGSVISDHTEGITDAHTSFYLKWLENVNLERQEQRNSRIPLWTEPSLVRERQSGLCAAGLILTEDNFPLYTFVQIKRSLKGGNTVRGAPELFDAVSLQPGDYVLLSSECGRFGLGHGRIVRLSTHSIVVEVRGDEPLRRPPERMSDNLSLSGLESLESYTGVGADRSIPAGQNFRGIVEIEEILSGSGGAACTTSHNERTPRARPTSITKDDGPSTLLWRVDKDAAESGYSFGISNLTRLCSSKLFSRLRSLIVDLAEPVFDEFVPIVLPPEAGDGSTAGMRDAYEALHRRTHIDMDVLRSISLGDSNVGVTTSPGGGFSDTSSAVNEDQRSAIRLALRANDYCLLQGMPGTGKTTAIAHLVFELAVRRRKRVFIACNTHTAVDNVLEKLLTLGVPFLRIGEHLHLTSELSKHTLESNTRKGLSSEQFGKLLEECRVFASTCMAVGRSVFSTICADVCIVDEAGQVSLPTVLGALMVAYNIRESEASSPSEHAGSLVLVGDHQQLPPLVRSRAAEQRGASESLFARLMASHREKAGFVLRLQYRMNSDIVAVSNKLVYRGELKCGSEAVAKKTLTVPLFPDFLPESKFSAPEGLAHAQWLRLAVNPDSKVLFLDTSLDIPGCQEPSSGALRNDGEAKIVHTLVLALCGCGVAAEKIGVISPYRAQLRAIRSQLSGGTSHEAAIGGVEVHTVDHFQGRDKDIIVLSLVRSNAVGKTGTLLHDLRRMNVAFTRAKKKLVVIGNRQTLSKVETCAAFFAHCDQNTSSVLLPRGAFEAFELAPLLIGERSAPRTASSATSSAVETRLVSALEAELSPTPLSPTPLSPTPFAIGSPLVRFREGLAQPE